MKHLDLNSDGLRRERVDAAVLVVTWLDDHPCFDMEDRFGPGIEPLRGGR